MIEIWQECTSFQTTSQRLADQVRTIIKKGWFSDLEILEINQKTKNEQDSKIISDTPSTEEQEQSNRNESPISGNRNNIIPNNTENTKNKKINLENLKRIMNKQMMTLPSLKKHENGERSRWKRKQYIKYKHIYQ